MIIPGNPTCTIMNDLIKNERRMEELIVNAVLKQQQQTNNSHLQQNIKEEENKRSQLTRPLIR